jgi:hypothetical protein
VTLILRARPDNRQAAPNPHTIMVSCQPRWASPAPRVLTSHGVAAVTIVLPANAKMKRRPLIEERCCGSLDITPDKAL